MTTTPATQALLPVTQSDRDALEALDDAVGFLTEIERPIVLQAFARHRQAPSLPGDVGHLKAVLDAAVEAAKVVEVCAILATKYDGKGNASIANGTGAAAHRVSAAYEKHMVRISTAITELAAALTPSALSGDAGEGE